MDVIALMITMEPEKEFVTAEWYSGKRNDYYTKGQYLLAFFCCIYRLNGVKYYHSQKEEE